MWGGIFHPSTRKSITDYFDVVNINRDEILGVVSVTVVFTKSPEKEYIFEIEESRFSADKAAIGDEILRQLQA